MTTDIQRALDKQAKLDAEATDGPWVREPGTVCFVRTQGRYVITSSGRTDKECASNSDLIAHLRNQAALARAVIEVVSSPFFDPATDHKDHKRLRDALKAWADHVNAETP